MDKQFGSMIPEKTNPHAELEERLRFETLIADLSSKFVNLPAGDVARCTMLDNPAPASQNPARN